MLTCVATISLARLGTASGYGWFGARLAMLGIGLALALPTVVALIINRVPAGQAGVASGLATMSRQFGGALGLAVLASVGSRAAGDYFIRHTGLTALRGLVSGGQISDVRRLAGARAAAIASQSFLHGFTVAMWIATAAAGTALVVVLVLVRAGGGLTVAGGPAGSGGLAEGSYAAGGGLADAGRALRLPTTGTSRQHPGPVPGHGRGAPAPRPPAAAYGDREGSGMGSTSATGTPAQGRPVRKAGAS